MALQKVVPFSFSYLGDGSSTTVRLTLATDYWFESSSQGSAAPTAAPTGVIFATDPGDGSTIALSLGVVTLTLATPPAAKTICTFSGYLLF
jgi:hypothetical protein